MNKRVAIQLATVILLVGSVAGTYWYAAATHTKNIAAVSDATAEFSKELASQVQSISTLNRLPEHTHKAIEDRAFEALKSQESSSDLGAALFRLAIEADPSLGVASITDYQQGVAKATLAIADKVSIVEKQTQQLREFREGILGYFIRE